MWIAHLLDVDFQTVIVLGTIILIAGGLVSHSIILVRRLIHIWMASPDAIAVAVVGATTKAVHDSLHALMPTLTPGKSELKPSQISTSDNISGFAIVHGIEIDGSETILAVRVIVWFYALQSTNCPRELRLMTGTEELCVVQCAEQDALLLRGNWRVAVYDGKIDFTRRELLVNAIRDSMCGWCATGPFHAIVSIEPPTGAALNDFEQANVVLKAEPAQQYARQSVRIRNWKEVPTTWRTADYENELKARAAKYPSDH